jgi:uncharacterized RDD family membrane protein YckC
LQDYLYAGFWKRLGAFLIDFCILAFSFIVVTIVSLKIVNVSLMDLKETRWMFNLMWLIFNWLYYALMESSGCQATLGKMAWGLCVTDLDGRRISFGRASGRYFGKILSGLIIFIGYFMIGFTRQKQALHDMMAGTLVVNKALASSGFSRRLEPMRIEAEVG